jgi:hypothetical protein
MQGWSNFYELIGGAAATLIGLLFVAVSVNADKILGEAHAHSRLLAEQAFQNYLAVLIITLIAFFPGISLRSFGYSVIGATLVWSAWIVTRIYLTASTAAASVSRLRTLRLYFGSFMGFVTLLYAGWQISFGKIDDHDDVAAGLLLLLISATLVSWELLISIASDKRGVKS